MSLPRSSKFVAPEERLPYDVGITKSIPNPVTDPVGFFDAMRPTGLLDNATKRRLEALHDRFIADPKMTVEEVEIERSRIIGYDGPHLLPSGTKYDGGKPMMDLLDPYAIEQLANVLTFGAKKYTGWNWAGGISYSRLTAACLRHVFAYLRGEDNDPESGLSHLAHAMCCLMFLLGLQARRHGLDDDRFKQPTVVSE